MEFRFCGAIQQDKIKQWDDKGLKLQEPSLHDWYKNGAVQYIASDPDHKNKYKYITGN